jgi:hypothetical protein
VKQVKPERVNTIKEVAAAAAAWAKAPAHVRAMAGAYVGPLQSAINAINDELQARSDKADAMAEKLRGLIEQARPYIGAETAETMDSLLD